MSGRDDLPGDPKEDLRKVSRGMQGGMDLTLPAIVEGVLVLLAALVGLGWLVAMWWVPDAISGEVWLGAGVLGLVAFGVPALAIHALRNGGVWMLEQVVRQLTG